MFLSRLVLNPNSRQVRTELAQPYEMHKTLMRAFPKATDEKKAKAREEFDVLFRADVGEDRNEVKVYVQSAIQPDWSFLDEVNDYLLGGADPPNPACRDMTKAYGRLREGRVCSFRLRANPTKRILDVANSDAGLKGKRVGLLGEEEQIAWLVRKSQERQKGKPGGFEIIMKEVKDRNGGTVKVPCVNVRPEGKLKGRKREDEQSHLTTHLAVRFDGLLRVVDPDAFRQTIVQGIGSAKGFGFGLLSIAPVSRE